MRNQPDKLNSFALMILLKKNNDKINYFIEHFVFTLA